MAKLSWVPISLFVLLSLVFLIEASSVMDENYIGVTYHPAGGEGSLRPEQCSGACSYRCSATWRKKACLKYCNICCKKCLCVPSGTYGHKEECPCYNNWKTKRGAPKCP